MGDSWSDRIKNLCGRIVREQDTDKLAELAMELDRVISEERERRKALQLTERPSKN